MEPVDPLEPPVEPLLPVEPLDEPEPEPMLPLEPVEPVEPDEPVEPVEPVEPLVPVEPVEPEPVEPDDPEVVSLEPPIEPLLPLVEEGEVDELDPLEPVPDVPEDPDEPLMPLPEEPDEPLMPLPDEPEEPLMPLPDEPEEPEEPLLPEVSELLLGELELLLGELELLLLGELELPELLEPLEPPEPLLMLEPGLDEPEEEPDDDGEELVCATAIPAAAIREITSAIDCFFMLPPYIDWGWNLQQIAEGKRLDPCNLFGSHYFYRKIINLIYLKPLAVSVNLSKRKQSIPLLQQHFQFLNGKRVAEKKSLHFIASVFTKKTELVVVGHAFCNHTHAEAMAQRNDGTGDDRVIRICADVAHE